MRAEILLPLSLELGEGARIIRGDLWFVDLLAGVLYRRDGDVATEVIRSPRPIGAAAAVAGSPTRLVLAEGLGVSVVDLANADAPADPVPRQRWSLGSSSEHATHRVNDAAVDRHGVLWVGTMPNGDGPPGAVFRVRGDRAPERVLDGIACPNGPAFGATGDVYLADTVARVILRSTLHDDGSLDAFEPWADVEGGLPDGMTVDADGCLWVAVWGASEVRRLDPSGRQVDAVALGASQPTSVCLAELDGQPSVVITSARLGLADPADGDGALWVAATDALPSAASAAEWIDSGSPAAG